MKSKEKNTLVAKNSQKKTFFLLCVLLISIVGLPACFDGIFPDASTSNFFSDQVAKIAMGKTDSKAIMDIFGKPVTKATDDTGKTTWVYTYERVASEYSLSNFKKLIVVFNRQMVVEDYIFEERHRGQSFIQAQSKFPRLLGQELIIPK